jgi:hypothetical protein
VGTLSMGLGQAIQVELLVVNIFKIVHLEPKWCIDEP